MASVGSHCLAAVVCALVGLGGPMAFAADQPCTNPDALGVSRVQEIDSTGNPVYGAGPAGAHPPLLEDHEVVLTFDDGPFPNSTHAIVSALQAQCTKATFFYVGQMALAYPAVLAEVDAAGMTIGTHTWSHANLRRLAGPLAQVEIERGISMLNARLGRPIAPFFRFPYLSTPASDVKYLGTRDFAIFAIDIDSNDSHAMNMPAPRIVNYVMTGLKKLGRGIILMHDIKKTTAEALPEILKQLKAGGYKVVNLIPKGPATSLTAYDDWAKQMIAKHDGGQAVAADSTSASAKAAKVIVRAPGHKHLKGAKGAIEGQATTGEVSASAAPVPEARPPGGQKVALGNSGSSAPVPTVLRTSKADETVVAFAAPVTVGSAGVAGLALRSGLEISGSFPAMSETSAVPDLYDRGTAASGSPVVGPRLASVPSVADAVWPRDSRDLRVDTARSPVPGVGADIGSRVTWRSGRTQGLAEEIAHGNTLWFTYAMLLQHRDPDAAAVAQLTALEVLSPVAGEEGVQPMKRLARRAAAAKTAKNTPVLLTVGEVFQGIFSAKPNNTPDQ